MTRKEQGKYFRAAEKERLLHQQLHPGWSNRENYVSPSRRRRARSVPPTLMEEGGVVFQGKMLTKAEKRRLQKVREDAQGDGPLRLGDGTPPLRLEA